MDIVKDLSEVDPLVDTTELGLGDCFFCLGKQGDTAYIKLPNGKGGYHSPGCLWVRANKVVASCED